jgi:hypothetical protein
MRAWAWELWAGGPADGDECMPAGALIVNERSSNELAFEVRP